MLQVSGLSKAYGARTLFDDVTFSLTAGERLGLIGRNGCGKSTLFRLILDVESPDQGSISLPRGYKVGHLAQHLEFHQENILKEACLGLPEEERDQEYRAEIILAGLGFSEADLLRAPSEFSGGFQIRLNLAKLLLSEPNLLLLDEPTNYLDIVSMRWLTGFLRDWKNEMILISHDRLFMDGVTTHTMLIHRGRIRKIPGGTEKLYNQVLVDEEVYEKTRINEDKKRRDLELFISRFRAQASKAAQVQSKIKMLEKMGKKEELSVEESLDFRFCEAPFPGKQVLEVENLSFAYPGGPTLIEDLNFSLGIQDRIGIIGKNGKGKSTLLKLLSGELSPVAGRIRTNQNASVGYFGQTNISRLSPSLTVEDEVSSANLRLHRTKVRAICGTMMFEGDDALKKISVLSGGEKSRVLLGRILALPTNFLLLDEPTNHLDMDAIESMIESLKEYHGAVVIVTHSELLLRELATRLIVFQGDKPEVLNYGYDYFLEKGGWGDDDEISSNSNSAKPAKPATPAPRSESKEQSKALRQVERLLAASEQKIMTAEEEAKALEKELAEASAASDIQKITRLSFRLKEVQEAIEKEFGELEKFSKRKAEIQKA
ncbi:MAG: ABC-F family ATP-binding cassette domain-containing protein [Deltaproteobacteria bacterium]|nr:ABC-F family ATP-binding cassette domain-containing protein [Deltaproteobacteria bacterium]